MCSIFHMRNPNYGSLLQFLAREIGHGQDRIDNCNKKTHKTNNL